MSLALNELHGIGCPSFNFKHAPQVERNDWFFMQKQSMGNHRDQLLTKSPIEFISITLVAFTQKPLLLCPSCARGGWCGIAKSHVTCRMFMEYLIYLMNFLGMYLIYYQNKFLVSYIYAHCFRIHSIPSDFTSPYIFTLQRVTSPDDCTKRCVGCSFSQVDV